MIRYAEALELDVEQFSQDLDSKELEKKIQDMENEGIQNGVTGTPSFFVNGRRIELAGSYEEFKASIEAAMNEQENPATTK